MIRAFVVCLIPIAAVAFPALASDVTTGQLDNGMQVVVIEDHRAPAVVQMVWYRSGSADEPAGQSGVAHFLEHLLFKATDTMAAGELSATVAANGGSDNAFTSHDYTAYFQRVAADRLDLMMQMESDRMNNLRLTEADIETERQVILEERNQRTENNPGALAREQMLAAQFLNHRYGVPVIGWRHEMESLSLSDALDFYGLYYSPNNAILVVAGDVEPEAVMEMARRHYGVIPAESALPERERGQEPPQRAERRLTFVDPRVSNAYLVRSYLAPERDTGAQEDAAALVYLAELLGGSPFTSALGVALQLESQTAVYTSASYNGSSLDDTTFELVVVPSEGVSLTDGEAALDAVLAGFLADGPDEARMDRIRTQLRASEIYAQDNVQRLAERYGAALAQGLEVSDVQAWPDILQAVTADQVRSVAQKVLDRRQSVTLWVAASDEEAK